MTPEHASTLAHGADRTAVETRPEFNNRPVAERTFKGKVLEEERSEMAQPLLGPVLELEFQLNGLGRRERLGGRRMRHREAEQSDGMGLGDVHLAQQGLGHGQNVVLASEGFPVALAPCDLPEVGKLHLQRERLPVEVGALDAVGRALERCSSAVRQHPALPRRCCEC